jgi:hypothetical protein
MGTSDEDRPLTPEDVDILREHLYSGISELSDGTILLSFTGLVKSGLPWELPSGPNGFELHIGPNAEMQFELLEYRHEPPEFRLAPIRGWGRTVGR